MKHGDLMFGIGVIALFVFIVYTVELEPDIPDKECLKEEAEETCSREVENGNLNSISCVTTECISFTCNSGHRQIDDKFYFSDKEKKNCGWKKRGLF